MLGQLIIKHQELNVDTRVGKDAYLKTLVKNNQPSYR
jgi:hypothetical protein